MGHYDFNIDIGTGRYGEIVIRDYLLTQGYRFGRFNDDNAYDLLMYYKDKPITYEIKTDVYPIDTGNMLIEFESRGKHSGIKTTIADYYVYYYYHLKEGWRISVPDLKELIEKHPFREVLCGDANSGTSGYLIPRHSFYERFDVRTGI